MDRTNVGDFSVPLELLQNVNDFGFIDFMDEANLEQFIELIRGEAEEPPATQFCANWDCGHVIDCAAPPTPTLFVPTRDDLRDLNLSSLYEFGSFPEEINVENETDVKMNEECFPTKTTATNQMKLTKKADRSRTLISERKRRGRMKEKLYALRSLVPNITKLDKASIIGDAIRYVKDLQTKTSKLKAEIASLESSLNQPHGQNHPGPGGFFQDAWITDRITMIPPSAKRILQMEVFQVEKREFYVRMVCNKRQGIAALLYKALDSLSLHVQNSNLATAAENYLLTFTLNVDQVNEMEMKINLPNLKLWIASVFCNQGFHFASLPSA